MKKVVGVLLYMSTLLSCQESALQEGNNSRDAEKDKTYQIQYSGFEIINSDSLLVLNNSDENAFKLIFTSKVPSNTKLSIVKGQRLNSTKLNSRRVVDTLIVNENSFELELSPADVSGYLQIKSISETVEIDCEYDIEYKKIKFDKQVIAVPVMPVELLVSKVK